MPSTAFGKMSSVSVAIQVFFSGAAVMALELVGSRILTPAFGNSINVWGNLIGIVLTGLSIGYYYGGRLADKKPSFGFFNIILFSAGLLIALIPFISPFALSLFHGLGERVGSLFTAATLLLAPTILLGSISPFAVKLVTRNLEELGGIAGKLYSISTVGSILGVFFTVFVLVPLTDHRTIMFLMGLLIMALSLVGLGLGARLLFVFIAALLILPLSGIVAGLYSHLGNIVYERESIYNHLTVVDSGEIRTLYLNGLPHSAMFLNGSNELVFSYTKLFHLGFLFNSEIRKVLFLGGGGFSGPKNFLEKYPQVTIDVVEIDDDVIQTARKYFNVREDPRLRIFNDDGRAFLTKTRDAYDLVILDAYSKSYIPFHLLTREFFSLLNTKLSNNGVIVSNVISSIVGDTSQILWAEYKTASEIFPHLYVFPTSSLGPGLVQNIVVVITKNREVFSQGQLSRVLEGIGDRIKQPDLSSFLSLFHSEPLITDETVVLTDNFAPVESLINPVTGKPYSLELETGLSRLPILVWSETGSATFSLILLSAFVWVYYVAKNLKVSK